MATTAPLYFNAAAYLTANPDVMKAIDSGSFKGTPLQHYLTYGINENRPLDEAGTTFNEAAYLAANPDVKAAGVNAKQHFLSSGYKENRPLGATASAETLASIKNYYTTYLGRTADAAGLAYWATAVVNGTPLTSIKTTLQTSPEAKGYAATAQITAAYQTYLGRTPNADGLQFWRDAVANGTSVADVVKSIQTSPEAKGYAATPAINSAYQTYLGRQPTTDELDYWRKDVANGATVAKTVSNIQAAPEAKLYAAKPALTAAYQTYLGRTPTQTDLDLWQKDLAAGNTVDKMTANIKESPEAKGYAATADITKAYKDYLGHAPDAEGLAFWKQAVANGTSVADVLKSIQTSPEANTYKATSQGLSLFNEAAYLAANPDVAAAVAKGTTTALEHFLKYGAAEGRPIDAAGTTFSEDAYLAANPDVAKAIKDGTFKGTGLDHYIQNGYKEGRAWDGSLAAVNNAFSTYVGRPPNAEELTYWQDQLKTNKLTISTFNDAIKKTDAASTYRVMADMYRTVLGREPDAAGAQFWWGEVNAGRIKTVDELANSILNSPEAAPYKTIASVYQTYTGASPTADEVNKWRDQVKSGQLSADALAATIKSTPAAQAYTDKTLTGAYKTYFGRDPDAEGLAFWKKAVADGMSLQDAVQTMRSSPEATTYAISKAPNITFNASAYLTANPDVMKAIDSGEYKGTPLQHFLEVGIKEGRAVDANGNKFSSAAYLAANPDVAEAIKNGTYKGTAFEHYLEFGSKENRPWSTAQLVTTQSGVNDAVVNAYRSVFGVEPSASDINYWASKVNSGALSLTDLSVAITKSPEAIISVKNAQIAGQPVEYSNDRATAITQIYQNWLGRTPSQAEVNEWNYGGVPIDAILNQISKSDEAKKYISEGNSVWATVKSGDAYEDQYGNYVQPTKQVLIPGDIAKLPDVVQKITESSNPEQLVKEIQSNPTGYMQNLFDQYSYMSGWYGKFPQDLGTRSMQDFQNTANQVAQWLVKNGVATSETLQSTWDTKSATGAADVQRIVLDQIHNDGGGFFSGEWLGDFLEKYEVSIMLAIAAPVMGAGFAAIAAGGAAAAGATAAVGSAAAASATAAGLGMAGMSQTVLAQAITAGIMGVANTGQALGNGANWEQALKTGVLSSTGSFLGTQLTSTLTPSITNSLISAGLDKATATTIATSVATSVGTSTGSGISAAVQGKDIGQAMLISGLSTMIGSTVANLSGSGMVGSVASGTATGMIAGQDFGTALGNSAFRGVMTAMTGLIRDGATASYDKLKETFTSMFGAGDKAAGYLATGVDKYVKEPEGGWTLTDRIAQAMNPDFNPDEYRRINGIEASAEAGMDYLTRGMEQGLPINAKEAAPLLAQARTDYVNAYLERSGYTDPSLAPPSLIAEVNKLVNTTFGDNLGAFKTAFATKESLDDSIGTLKESDYAARLETEFASGETKFTPKFEYAGWNQPSSDVFKMPAGMKFASEADIGKVIARDPSVTIYSAYDTKGQLVYMVKDESYVPPKVYDNTTGTVTTPKPPTTTSGSPDLSNSALGSLVGTSSSIGYNMFNGVKDMTSGDKLKFFATASDETLKDVAKSFPSVGTATGANRNEWLVETIRAGAIQIRNEANKDDANLIYKIMDKGLDVAATGLEGLASITSGATFISGLLHGENPNNLPTMQVTRTLNDIMGAVRSEEMKTSIQSYTDILRNSEGTSVVGALLSNVADNPAGALNFIGASLVSSLPGFAAGKYLGGVAGAAAELEGFSSAVVNKITGGVAVATSRVYEIGLEGASNGMEAFNDFYTAYKKANPTWDDAQLTDAAMSGAKLVAGSAMAVTLGTQVIGLDKLTQNLLGVDNPSGTVFKNVLDKLIATPIAEAVQEGPYQSGVPTIVKEMILKEIDPTRTMETAVGQILGQTTLGAIAGLGSAGAIGLLQLPSDIVGSAVASNPTFQLAVQNAGYTLGGLNSVLDTWLPITNVDGTGPLVDARNSIISNTLASNPEFASGYASVNTYIDAVKDELGVWQPVILADVAASNPKFAGDVVTLPQGIKLLQDAGATNPTQQDVINSGILGVKDTNKIALLPQYVSTLPSQTTTPTTPTTPTEPTTPTTPTEPTTPTTPTEPTTPTTPTEPTTPTTPTGPTAQQLHDQLLAKVEQYRNQGYTESQSLQAAIDTVSQSLGTTKTDLLSQIGTTETALRAEITSQVSETEARLADLIAENESNNMQRDSATQKAVDDLSAELGITKTDLLERIDLNSQQFQNEIQIAKTDLNRQLAVYGQQTTQQVQQATALLQAQIAANQAAGMDAVAATNKAVQDVAAQLGTTTTNLQNQIATSNSQLAAQIQQASQASQAFTQSQIGILRDDISKQMQANLNAGMQSDAALQKAINDVAANLGTTANNLLTQMGTNQAQLQTQITQTQQQVTAVKDQLLAKIDQYKAQGYSADQALQAAIDTVAQSLGTTKTDLLAQIGTTETALRAEITSQVGATEQRLADLIAEKEAANMSRDQATQAAVDQLAGELGTTRTDLLNKIDLTSQQFQNEINIAKTDLSKQLVTTQQQTAQQIADTKAQIQQQMAAYQQAGIDRDTALGLAVSSVAQDLGTTKSDLLTKLGTSETTLRNEFTQQTTALSTQIQDVAKILGKPATQVTANDITMVQNMIANQTATNLAYDVNQDQKVDAQDLTLLQQQQQIQTKTGVKTVVDPNTGLTTYVDTATNQPITGFDVTGTQWAPTGIYDVLNQQQLEQEQIAKTQAETAKQTQQKNNFTQMMNMVLGASDVSGRKVEVKTPDPSRINYIYDFSSIFATPQQAGLFPSPYGAVNTYGQPAQGLGSLQTGMSGQAANQGLYGAPSKMAVGGFAEGGMIGGDISVGDGGSVDDLLNILKGNSG